MLKTMNRILGLSGIFLMILIIAFTNAKADQYVLKDTDFVLHSKGWIRETPDARDVPVEFNKVLKVAHQRLLMEREADSLIAYHGGIAFFTSDLDTKVFVNGEKVYDTLADRGNQLCVSSGRIWNYVKLPEIQRGDKIEIEYLSTCSLVSEMHAKMGRVESMRLSPIYVGSEYAYTKHIFTHNILMLALAYVMVLLGIVVVIFAYQAFYRKRISGADYLLYFGLCILFSGMYLILSNLIITSMKVDVYLINELKNLCVLYAVLSLGLCMTKGIEDRWMNVGYVTIVFAFAMMGLRLASYFYKPLAPYMVSLSTDAYIYIMLLAAGVADWLYAHRNKTGSWSCWSFFAAAGLASIDYLILAYYNVDRMYFRTLGLLVYFGHGTAYEISMYLRLYEGAKEKEEYKILAGTDQATGLKNRLFLKDMLPDYEANREGLAMLMMDVNGLKEVNDSQGHAKGDELLSASAKLIVDHFEDLGDCYRVGGDEFLVVIKHGNATKIQERIMELRKATRKESRRRTFSLSIAIGLAVFRESVDINVEDTMRRADTQMYIDKRAMKLRASEEKIRLAEGDGDVVIN